VWLTLAPAALLGFAANQALFAAGMARTTPAHAAVINTSIPITTLALAVLARQERASRAKMLGIALALTGVSVLLRVDRLLVSDAAEGGETLVGDLLILGNATVFSAFLVLMRKLARDVAALTATAICFAWATAMVAPWSWPEISTATLAPLLEPGILPWALFVILAATVLTYLLNNWALRHTHSSQVALYIYTQPVIATALSIALGRDRLSLRFMIAAALVFGGIALPLTASRAARPPRDPRAASPTAP
jgi:drug/metabolite transporter (DMT)-like permease